MKNLILLLLTSIIAFAADQPSVRQRRVVLENNGISTNQTLVTPTVPGIANGALVKQTAGGLDDAVAGSDFVAPGGSGSVTGLSTGKVPYATGAAVLGDSPISVSGTNITAIGTGSFDSLVSTNGIISGSTSAGSVTIGDGGSEHFRIAPPDISTSINFIPPAAPFNGIPKYTVTSGTNWTKSSASAGTDYTTPSSTEIFTNKTLDSAGTGNVLKFTDYKDFVYPSRVDGAGATIVTNDYTSGLWGLATYSGSADTNGNYAIFRIGTVPYDMDTGAAMTLKGFSVRVSATDTDAAEFTIALWSPASSSSYTPTDFTSLSTFINFDSGTLTSPAANDIFYFSDVTLTGWAAALTAGRPFIIGIARRNGSNDDSVTIVSGVIEYGRTK